MASTVDERGRVLVPRDLRIQFGLEPGCPVIFEADEHGIRLRRAIPRKEAMKRLIGVIPKSAGPSPIDPLRLKEMWEPRP